MKTNGRPSNFEKMRDVKKYMRLGEIDKERKIRIVQPAIGGWIDWEETEEGKRIPHRTLDQPKKLFDPSKKAKRFWAMYVWDYERKDLFILEVTQQSVLNTLDSIGDDIDLTSIDLKFKKEGSGMQSKYSVIPSAPTALDAGIKSAKDKVPVNLEALFYGGDPWKDLDAALSLALK